MTSDQIHRAVLRNIRNPDQVKGLRDLDRLLIRIALDANLTAKDLRRVLR
jgi:hypothetical protein